MTVRNRADFRQIKNFNDKHYVETIFCSFMKLCTKKEKNDLYIHIHTSCPQFSYPQNFKSNSALITVAVRVLFEANVFKITREERKTEGYTNE